MGKRTVLALAAAAAFGLGLAGHARGDVVFNTGNTPQPDENVLFNLPGLVDNGTTVTGATNNTALVVSFTGDETLTTPSAGQARIASADGNGFSNLLIQLQAAGGVFESVILNIDADVDGSVTFFADPVNSATGTPLAQETQTFSLSGSGSNFFTITTDAAQSISKLRFVTDVAATLDNVDNVSQIRLGGAHVVPTPTSALGGLALLGGLGAVHYVRRRRLA